MLPNVCIMNGPHALVQLELIERDHSESSQRIGSCRMDERLGSATSDRICLDSLALQAIRFPDQEHWVREQIGTSTEGDGASGADVKTERGLGKRS